MTDNLLFLFFYAIRKITLIVVVDDDDALQFCLSLGPLGYVSAYGVFSLSAPATLKGAITLNI